MCVCLGCLVLVDWGLKGAQGSRAGPHCRPFLSKLGRRGGDCCKGGFKDHSQQGQPQATLCKGTNAHQPSP